VKSSRSTSPPRSSRTSWTFLGTTPRFLAAHRFYEKNGFSEVEPGDLPSTFPIMAVDKKFYRRRITAGR
jgi:hypothetical protein